MFTAVLAPWSFDRRRAAAAYGYRIPSSMTARAAKTLHLDSNLSRDTTHAGTSSRRRHPFVFGDGGLQMGVPSLV